MDAPGVTSKKRLLWALGLTVAVFALLIVQLFNIQVLNSATYAEKAENQQTRNTVVSAVRGMVIDSTGVVLARNGTAYKIVIWPQSIKTADGERVARELAAVLGMDEATVLGKVTDKTKQEIVLARQVERSVVDKILSLKLGGGVGTAIDTKRYYSSGAMYSQLLGFTTIDGVGQAGLEQKCDKYLSGTDGRMITETDRKGNPLAYGVQELIEAEDGADVYLTTNAVLQSALEEACAEALEVNNASNVQGIIMNAKTGEVLAITTQPDYDPNDPPRSDMALLNALMRNRVVSDAYEPGSTFKLITLAAALDTGAVTLDSAFECPGYHYVNGEKIRCWKSGGHGSQTLEKAVQNSCNPSFMIMAANMGVEEFYEYIYSFGFGASTSSGIPGESGGIVTHQKYINDNTLARIGFGQSIAVTPLQLASAVCAAVNGGQLMQPYVVDRIVAPDGTVLLDNEPTVVRRVISEETSALVRRLAESVVAEGSGKNAAIPGYRVGGKTGTAQKYGEDGSVATGGLIASFIGFAPADDPEFLCLILVDEPQVGQVFGSTVAAPFVKDVLEEALHYAGYLPAAAEAASVPDVVGMSVKDAVAALKDAGLEATSQDGDEEIVTAQVPSAGSTAVKGAGVLLYTAVTAADSAEDITTELVKVPNLIGMTKLQAADALIKLGLKIRIDPPDQSGGAIRQSPEPETMVEAGTEVLVDFSNTNIGT